MKIRIRRLFSFVDQNSLLVFIVTAVLTVFFGYFALQLKVDPNVETLLPENTEIRKAMEKYRREGITGEYLLLAVTGEQPFTVEKLSVYYRVIKELEDLPGLEKGITPFDLMTFEKSGSRLTVVPVAANQQPPSTPEELSLFQRRLTDTPYAQNLVVSPDGTVLNSFFPAGKIDDFSTLMDEVRHIVADLDGYYSYYVSGSIPFVDRTEEYISRDLVRLFSLSAIIILLFYFLGFRTFRGVLLPFLVIVLGTVWSLGFMSLVGYTLTIVSIITPPIVLTLGSSYSIHILNEYYRSTRSKRRDHNWVAGVIENVNMTILMAAATTIVGFLGLLAANIRQTREFAISAGFGILSCTVLSLFLFPALLSRLPTPKERQSRRIRSGLLARLMTGLGRLVIRAKVPIIGVAVLLSALFAVVVPRINTNTDTIGYFPQGDKVVQDMYFLTGKLGGFDEINITLTAPDSARGFFLKPENLAWVSKLELDLRANPNISYNLSFTTYLRFLNRVMTGSDEIPTNRAPILLLSRLQRALAGVQADSLATTNLNNEDFSQLTLSFRVYNSRTQKFIDEQALRDLLRTLEYNLDASTPSDVRAEIWGMSLQYLTLSNLLRQNLIKSMLISIALVFAITTAAFRSLRYGFLAILPLVMGVMLNFILMGILGIPLDMTTIMVSAVAIGVGVDDAIHFLIYYRRHLRELGGDRPEAMKQTLAVTGRPILLTTVSIVGGLLALCLSSFSPILYFGILVVITLSAACASTLVLLPAVLLALPEPRKII
ncbi:MAG: RND family transporter [Spirochaetaceae bacterium]|nr:MAG: RND family transporter [Spirochaetaceae bacterium]